MSRKATNNVNSLPSSNRPNGLKIKHEHLRQVKPITQNQKRFFHVYDAGTPFIMLHGTAGTGKSYISLYKAFDEVLSKSNIYTNVIIVRSAVPSRDIGHLPGDVDDKIDIYQQPYKEICTNLFSRGDGYSRLVEQDKLSFISTSYVRGVTFDNSILIVDEIQNMSFQELDTIFTRIGHHSKIIMCGDLRQCDLQKKGSQEKSGLREFISIAKSMSCFDMVEFLPSDIVRSSMVKEYIIARDAMT